MLAKNMGYWINQNLTKVSSFLAILPEFNGRQYALSEKTNSP